MKQKSRTDSSNSEKLKIYHSYNLIKTNLFNDKIQQKLTLLLLITLLSKAWKANLESNKNLFNDNIKQKMKVLLPSTRQKAWITKL